MSSRHFFIVYFVFLAGILSACNNRQPGTSGKQTGASGKQAEARPADHGPALVRLTEEQWKNAGIVTDKLVKKDISATLKLNGAIDVPPQNMVSISVPLGGYLRSTRLLPGMHVFKGETIAIMEDQQYIQLQQDFLTARASLDLAAREYERQAALNQDKAASDKVYQQALADYTTKKVLVKGLYEKLKLAGIDPDRLDEQNMSRSVRIPAPIDGFVSKVNVNVGKYVNPSDVLFEIVNPDDIHLGLTVFEKDLPYLYIGQQVMAYTNNDPSRQYPCEIILIGKDFSPERSVQVHCHFRKYDKQLIPGMFMNAEIRLKTSRQDALPSDAIVSFQGKKYIFVVKEGAAAGRAAADKGAIANKGAGAGNGTAAEKESASAGERQFEMIEVQIGDSGEGYTAVSFGNGNLPDDIQGREIVVKGAYTLLMSLKNTGGQEEE